jgi:hypothetical protein
MENVMKHYGMFTEAGNRAVDGLVLFVKTYELDFSAANKLLGELSKLDGFGEATDTAVREYVYEALEGV